MRNLAHSLEGLKGDLASIQHDIFILEQTLRQLSSVVDAGADELFRARLDVIAGRMSAALTKHVTISRLMEECGLERYRASFV
jgi:hypothetical protein